MGAAGELEPWRPIELVNRAAEECVRLRLHPAGDGFTVEARPWPWVIEDAKLAVPETPVRRTAVTAEEWEKWLRGRDSALGLVWTGGEWRTAHEHVVQAKRDIFEGADSELDLADLTPPPEEIGDALHRAQGSEFIAYAWSRWHHWRGDFDLIAHVGRVSTEFLADLGRASDSKIEIGVGQDIERFDTPGALTTDLTGQARRGAEWASVTTRATGCSARVVWAAHGLPAESLVNAVLLECESSLEDRDLCERWRERLAKAIDRGRPPGGSAVTSGQSLVAKDADGLQRPFAVRDQPFSWTENWGGPFLACFLFLWFVIPIFGSIGGKVGLYLSAGTVVLLILFWISMLIFYPGVEIGPRSNSSSMRKLLAGAVASGAGVILTPIGKHVAAQLGLGG